MNNKINFDANVSRDDFTVLLFYYYFYYCEYVIFHYLTFT